jgi:hypothetical protein
VTRWSARSSSCPATAASTPSTCSPSRPTAPTCGSNLRSRALPSIRRGPCGRSRGQAAARRSTGPTEPRAWRCWLASGRAEPLRDPCGRRQHGVCRLDHPAAGVRAQLISQIRRPEGCPTWMATISGTTMRQGPRVRGGKGGSRAPVGPRATDSRRARGVPQP